MADDPTKPPEGAPKPPEATPETPAPRVDPDVVAAARREADDLRARLALESAARQRLEEAQAAAERKRLEEEGKWKELAENEGRRALESEKLNTARLKEASEAVALAELKARLALEGVEDLDYYLLADRSKITVDGTKVNGLDDVITDLKTRKPHIFTKPARPVVTTTTTATAPAPASTTEAGPLVDVRKMTKEEYAAHKHKTLREFRRRA